MVPPWVEAVEVRDESVGILLTRRLRCAPHRPHVEDGVREPKFGITQGADLVAGEIHIIEVGDVAEEEGDVDDPVFWVQSVDCFAEIAVDVQEVEECCAIGLEALPEVFGLIVREVNGMIEDLVKDFGGDIGDVGRHDVV